jgi:hypothetical protein
VQSERAVDKQNPSVYRYSSVVLKKDAIARNFRRTESLRMIYEGVRIIH